MSFGMSHAVEVIILYCILMFVAEKVLLLLVISLTDKNS